MTLKMQASIKQETTSIAEEAALGVCALGEGIVSGWNKGAFWCLGVNSRVSRRSRCQGRGVQCLHVFARASAPSAVLSGVEGEVIIQKVLGKPFTVGYNAMVDKVVDLIEEGVIDPAKVTRNGLMNACSIAGIMLTTQVREGGGLSYS